MRWNCNYNCYYFGVVGVVGEESVVIVCNSCDDSC